MWFIRACAFNKSDIYVKANNIEGFFELILIKLYLEEACGNWTTEAEKSQTVYWEKLSSHY